MDKILPDLYLGSLEDGQTCAEPIEVCFNICEHSYEPKKYMVHAPIEDEVFHDARIWQGLVAKLYSIHHDEINHRVVLVHCRLGISRAPSLVAAYLAYCGYTRDVDHALVQVTKQRPIAYPHMETWRGVRAWWAQSRGVAT